MSMLEVQIHSQERILPEIRPEEIINSPLSVADSSVVRFSTTAAVWFFDSSVDERRRDALSADYLRASLRRTLNWYCQWSGQLRWTVYAPKGDHTHRVGRLRLTYGAPTDPGVEFVVASSARSLSAFLPSPSERLAESGVWNAAQVPSAELLPPTRLPLHDLIEHIGLPAVGVQVTTFACGSTAVAVKMAHPLADAHTLAHFVHHWATVNRAMLEGLPVPVVSPMFDPQKLDYIAAGDIDAAQPDPDLVAQARALPSHRYDWWATPDESSLAIPPGLEPAQAAPPGDPMPWSEWDPPAPVGHYLLHFTAQEVHSMREECRRSADPSSSAVSLHDALLAHIWTLINRARGLAHDERDVHMNVSLGLRSRVSPPLPDGFLGSPLVLGRVSLPGRAACAGHPGAVAARIRDTLTLFDARALAAHLHDMAHDAALVRTWHAFLGNRNVIATSWVRLRLYGVDFGSGSPPRYVEAVMPSCDGCVQIMEAAPVSAAGAKGERDRNQVRHWCDDGVDVSVHLEAEALKRLVEDPLLHKYAQVSNMST
ncbi:transferase protein [Wolfiporia cocos MD-104 SS10]|uniref:Transferase protein n=1 Tax=Wolfiporia cocos (strain MD-104) TaxID=742152 RepID=A0A2H3J8C7_WOLCO|nr:transferase protein [Wolfiporia cocos MD-104 SS10]